MTVLRWAWPNRTGKKVLAVTIMVCAGLTFVPVLGSSRATRHPQGLAQVRVARYNRIAPDPSPWPTPQRAPAPPPIIASPNGDLPSRIIWCESRGQTDAVNPHSTASGEAQWLDSSWVSAGYAAETGTTRSMQASKAQQDAALRDALHRYGTSPWAASSSCWAR